MPLKGHLNPPKLTKIKGTFTTKLLEPARNFSIGKALSEIERKKKKDMGINQRSFNQNHNNQNEKI